MDWQDNKKKGNKKTIKGNHAPVKKRDKAWKARNKSSNHKSSHEIDDDILYMMNQTRCNRCNVIYSLTLNECPNCIK